MRASNQPAAKPKTTFSLERFAWDTPDRLELSGWFCDMAADAPDPPFLVVRAGDASLRLPAVSKRLSGPPQDGRRWSASFAWEDAPAAFERARLELGEMIVDLPQPRPQRAQRGDEVLDVRQAGVADPPQKTSPADRLALQAAELLAQEETSSLRSTVERLQRDLERAQADVDAERRQRTADAERFRDGLAKVRASAEEALAAERASAAHAARELDDARRRLGEQRVRLGEMERFAQDAERRQAALRVACADTERLLARLVALRDTPLNGKPS
jgi:hypothetical protein